MGTRNLLSDISDLLIKHDFKVAAPESQFDWRKGNYSCKIDADSREIVSIFGRFDKPRSDLGNPYSGKHNFHQFKNKMGDYSELENFLSEIQ